jgi:hypothetical protein
MPERKPQDASTGSINASLFQTGDRVPASGLYAVVHADHQLPKAVFLAIGNEFPRCSICTSAVTFWLLQQKHPPSGFEADIRSLPVQSNPEANSQGEF